MRRHVYGDDAERITEPVRPRFPGKQRGIRAVNEDECERVARAAVPDVGTRAVRQRHELRRRASVLRLENRTGDIGLADIPKRARQQEKEPSANYKLSHAADIIAVQLTIVYWLHRGIRLRIGKMQVGANHDR